MRGFVIIAARPRYAGKEGDVLGACNLDTCDIGHLPCELMRRQELCMPRPGPGRAI